jgi:hypothetical protein
VVRLVACRLRKLNKAQKNYPVHEKEMLALIDALEDWRHYLLGYEIHIFTDNSALRYLQNSARPSTRQVRWLEKLQMFEPLKIAHIPGKTNTAADALSRSPALQDAVEIPPELDLSFLGEVVVTTPQPIYFQPSAMAPMITTPPPSWWEEYLADVFIRKKYFKPDTELLDDPRIFHNERLWKHDRIIVPKTKATEIIAMYHDSPSAGHWGVNRTVGLIRRRYHIDHLRRLVRRYCRSCVACQQAKARHNRPRGLMEQLEIPARPWHSISMDWTNLPTIKDDNGKKFNQVLTVTDRASKQVKLIPCWWEETAPQVPEVFLQHVVRER